MSSKLDVNLAKQRAVTSNWKDGRDMRWEWQSSSALFRFIHPGSYLILNLEEMNNLFFCLIWNLLLSRLLVSNQFWKWSKNTVLLDS